MAFLVSRPVVSPSFRTRKSCSRNENIASPFNPTNHRRVLSKQLRVTPAEAQLLDMSYYIGKGIILFTFFYCSLNWMHYRNLRKDDTDDDGKTDDKKK